MTTHVTSYIYKQCHKTFTICLSLLYLGNTWCWWWTRRFRTIRTSRSFGKHSGT